MKFAQFMARPIGRGLRIIIGVAAIIGGAVALANGSLWGLIPLLIGAVLAIAGTVNVCPIALLIGAPFSGRRALEAAA